MNVAPQSLEAEEHVLGAMMLSPGAIEAAGEVLSPQDFYRESHGKIFQAARDVYANGGPVDAITLVDELEWRGQLEEVGGRMRIHELATLVPVSANAGHYARIVRRRARERDAIREIRQVVRASETAASVHPTRPAVLGAPRIFSPIRPNLPPGTSPPQRYSQSRTRGRRGSSSVASSLTARSSRSRARRRVERRGSCSSSRSRSSVGDLRSVGSRSRGPGRC